MVIEGAELPAAIRALVTSEAQTETEEAEAISESPLMAIFGGSITGKERASNGDIILRGENGIFATRTTWIDRNDQPETVWEFDLPPQERVWQSTACDPEGAANEQRDLLALHAEMALRAARQGGGTRRDCGRRTVHR